MRWGRVHFQPRLFAAGDIIYHSLDSHSSLVASRQPPGSHEGTVQIPSSSNACVNNVTSKIVLWKGQWTKKYVYCLEDALASVCM